MLRKKKTKKYICFRSNDIINSSSKNKPNFENRILIKNRGFIKELYQLELLNKIIYEKLILPMNNKISKFG